MSSKRPEAVRPNLFYMSSKRAEAEFNEFEPRLKFETRLKFGWFHLKLYSVFQDLSRRSIETVFCGFKTRLKFIKFGLCFHKSLLRYFSRINHTTIHEAMKNAHNFFKLAQPLKSHHSTFTLN